MGRGDVPGDQDLRTGRIDPIAPVQEFEIPNRRRKILHPNPYVFIHRPGHLRPAIGGPNPEAARRDETKACGAGVVFLEGIGCRPEGTSRAQDHRVGRINGVTVLGRTKCYLREGHTRDGFRHPYDRGILAFNLGFAHYCKDPAYALFAICEFIWGIQNRGTTRQRLGWGVRKKLIA